MRLRYFGYSFEELATGINVRQAIGPLLDAYCHFQNSDFKNGFKHNEETVFLLKERDSHYVFVKTKDTEIIKTVDKASISIEEINAKLAMNESIGFASHLYVTNDFIAFGSTHLAPTVSSFGEFVNVLLHRLGCTSHRLALGPLVTQITRAEAASMKFVGATKIRVNRLSSIFQDMVEVLGIDPNSLEDLQSFELIIRPLNKRDIKNISDKLATFPPLGIENFEIRAKAELHDRLADFRIENSLVLADLVQLNRREDIYSAIERVIDGNRSIQAKVTEYDEENDITAGTIDAVAKYHSHNNWPVDRPNPEGVD